MYRNLEPPNGYCYEKWLYQLRIYNSEVDIVEIKNILGRFPKIKDVLSVLYKNVNNVSFKFYYPKFVSNGIYHLKGTETLVSLLDLMIFFSDGEFRIGGENANAFFSTITEMAGIEADALLGDIVKEKLKQKDSQIYMCAENCVLERVGSVAKSKLSKERLDIRINVSSEEECQLQRNFPELNLNFSLKTVQESHGLAHAFRLCELQIHLQILGLRNPFQKPRSYDVACVDVGGNFLMHLRRGRRNIHCCSPRLTAYDNLRHSKRRQQLNRVKLNESNIDLYKDYCRNENEIYNCDRLAQHCKITAPVGFCLHSSYDISVQEIADIMEVKRMNTLSLSFIFDAEILVNEEGFLSKLGIYYKKCFVDKVFSIIFSFVGDSSLVYIHKYETYLSLVRNSFITSTSGQTDVFIEMGTNRDGIQFILATRNRMRIDCRVFFSHNVWFKDYNKKIVVEYWTYDVDALVSTNWFKKNSGKFGMSRVRLVVPKKLVDDIMQYALRLNEGKFNVNEVYGIACSYNTRMIGNGKDILTPERISALDLHKLSHAIYAYCYVKRHAEGMCLKLVLEDIKKQREHSDKSLLRQVFNRFMGEIKGFFSNDMTSFRNDAFVDEMEGVYPNNSFKNINFLRRNLSVWAKYDALFPISIKNSVQFIEFSDLVEVEGNYYDLRTVLPGIEVGKIKLTEEQLLNVTSGDIRQALNRVIGEDRYESMAVVSACPDVATYDHVEEILQEDSESCSTVGGESCSTVGNEDIVCGDKLVCVDVVGDGQCFYRSIIGALKLSEGFSVEQVRNIIAVYISKSKNYPGNDYLKSLRDDVMNMEEWGGIEMLPYVSRAFNVSICVHFFGKNMMIRNKSFSSNIIHLNYLPNHWNYFESLKGGYHCDGEEVDADEGLTLAERLKEALKQREENLKSKQNNLVNKSVVNKVVLADPNLLEVLTRRRQCMDSSDENSVASSLGDDSEENKSKISVKPDVGILNMLKTIGKKITSDEELPLIQNDEIVKNCKPDFCTDGPYSDLSAVGSVIEEKNSLNSSGLGSQTLSCDSSSIDSFLTVDSERDSVLSNFYVKTNVKNFSELEEKIFENEELQDVFLRTFPLIPEREFDFSKLCKLFGKLMYKKKNSLCSGSITDSGTSSISDSDSDSIKNSIRILESNSSKCDELTAKLESFSSEEDDGESEVEENIEIEKNFISRKKILTAVIDSNKETDILHKNRDFGKQIISKDVVERDFLVEVKNVVSKKKNKEKKNKKKGFLSSLFMKKTKNIKETVTSHVVGDGVCLDDFDIVEPEGESVKQQNPEKSEVVSVISKPQKKNFFKKKPVNVVKKLSDNFELIMRRDYDLINSVEEYEYASSSVNTLRMINKPLNKSKLVLHFVHNYSGGYKGFANDVMLDCDNFVSISNQRKNGKLTENCFYVTTGKNFEVVINVPSSPVTFKYDLKKIMRILSEKINRNICIDIPAVGMGLFRAKPEDVLKEFKEFEDNNKNSPIKYLMHFSDSMLYMVCKKIYDQYYPSEPTTDIEKYWEKENVFLQNAKFENHTDSSAIARNSARELLEMWDISEKIHAKHHSVAYNKLNSCNVALTDDHTWRMILDSNDGYGVLDMNHGKFLKQPKTIRGQYMCGFDGKNFVKLKLIGKNMYEREDKIRTGFLLVSNYTEKMIDRMLYNACEVLDIDNFVIPNVQLTQGVPGCGKTTYILNEHKGKKHPGDSCDLVLTTTRDAAEDIKKRVEKLGYIADKNYYRTVDSFLINSKIKCDTVFMDEALMLHSGYVTFVALKTNCKKIILLGDRAQIPYINRIRTLKVKYSGYDHIKTGKVLKTTYRCPVDVACVLKDKYEDGMFSASNVMRSLGIKIISNLSQVPLSKDIKYLVFKQSEKEELINKGYNVSTIHEFQGNQAKNIAVVRLSNKPLESIYLSEPHALVAISRHTVSFVYYTMVVADALGKLCNAQISEQELNDCKIRDLGKGGFLIKFGKLNVNDNGYVDDFVRLNLGDNIKPLFCISDKEKIDFKKKKIFTERQVGYESSAELLQYIYDDIFPGNSTHFMTHDSYMVEFGDLDLQLDDVMLETSKRKFNVKSFDNLKPVLRTAIPAPRRSSQIEMLLALLKRNKNVPELQQIGDQSMMVELMKKKFFGYLNDTGREKQKIYEKNIVTINSFSIQDWLQGQTLKVERDCYTPSPIWDVNLTFYKYMIKSTVKPKLDLDAPYEYSSLQTIAYTEKFVNMYFCPIFREIKKRLLTTLDPRFKIFTDCSAEEFADSLNEFITPEELYRSIEKVLEIDISKYDKSQTELLLLFEIEIYKMFGLSEFDAVLWYNAHKFSFLRDAQDGVGAWVWWQRKSGDAATFLGNTIVLMGVISVLFDLSEISMGLFAGDDSALFGKGFEVDKNLLCGDLFNLESKFFFYEKTYFCSKFLLAVDNYWVLLPDPVKVLTKLGRHDLVNYEHVEEYRVSLIDLIKMYKYLDLDMVLSSALVERYPCMRTDVGLLLHSLYYIINSKEKFKNLFYINEGDKICYDPSRPKNL